MKMIPIILLLMIITLASCTTIKHKVMIGGQSQCSKSGTFCWDIKKGVDEPQYLNITDEAEPYVFNIK
jgi:hypothetical protein